MKIEIGKRVDGARLYDEIVAAVPSLAPVAAPDGTNEETPLVLLTDADTVYIDVPDGTDEAAVRAAVAAHNPDVVLPPVPDPYEEMRKIIDSAASLGDVKKLAPWFDVLAKENRDGANAIDVEARYRLAGIDPTGKKKPRRR